MLGLRMKNLPSFFWILNLLFAVMGEIFNRNDHREEFSIHGLTEKMEEEASLNHRIGFKEAYFGMLLTV